MIAMIDPRRKEHDALMDIDAALMGREAAIVAREMEYPPFRWADESPPGRLAKAEALVLADRVHPLADPPGTWLVQGKTTTYTVAERCTCKQGQHGSSKFCYHVVSVELYRRLQARLGRPIPPWVGGLSIAGQPLVPAGPRTPLVLSEDTTGLDDETLPLLPDHTTPDGDETVPAYCEWCGAVSEGDARVSTRACGHTLCALCAGGGCPACREYEAVEPYQTPPVVEELPMAVEPVTPTVPPVVKTACPELTLPATRSIQAIVADLSRPLPDACLVMINRDGRQIPGLHWYTVRTLLDTYAPGWQSRITTLQVDHDVCRVVCRLGIRSSEGMVWREGTGEKDDWEADPKQWGNPAANAEANAFKRAASKFGVGIWLYERDQTSTALKQHLKEEKTRLLAELGKVLDARQMPRPSVLDWLKATTGAEKTQDIPLSAIQGVLTQLAGG